MKIEMIVGITVINKNMNIHKTKIQPSNKNSQKFKLIGFNHKTRNQFYMMMTKFVHKGKKMIHHKILAKNKAMIISKIIFKKSQKNLGLS